MNTNHVHEVAIIGGGPAGLSAATLLGSAMRDVVICDAGHPRNERSPAMHRYLGLDGINPLEFLQQCRDQLMRYSTVSYVKTTVTELVREGGLFVIHDAVGGNWKAKSLLLATGLVDQVPEIPGIDEYYGISIHVCPYCDGWENRGKPLGVIGANDDAIELACELRLWSDEVTLIADMKIDEKTTARLKRSAVRVVPGKVCGLESVDGKRGQLAALLIDEGGTRIPCQALFFSPVQAQHSLIARSVGRWIEGREIDRDEQGRTEIPGLFVAGNMTRGIQMAIVAAATGMASGAAINSWLMDLDVAETLSEANS